jgi:alkylated DNA repair protein alkB family protein 1
MRVPGVPRILEDTLPPHLQEGDGGDEEWAPYAEYLRTARINVNVRQVFPKGFEPFAGAG